MGGIASTEYVQGQSVVIGRLNLCVEGKRLKVWMVDGSIPPRFSRKGNAIYLTDGSVGGNLNGTAESLQP